MFAHEVDKVEGSDGPSVVTGAYADLGARKRGAFVFFGVYAACADSVYLVGSFNDWKDTHPMKKTDRGVWELKLERAKITDGDTYKYKICRDGETTYLTDPYSFETDGEPYFNSVYRDIPPSMSGTYEREQHIGCLEEPLSIYQIKADGWLLDKNGRSLDYTELSRELIPYILQMGYTHVNISGFLEKYYDSFELCCAEAYFAPSSEQGGIESLRSFVHAMHRASVGVLVDWNVDKTFGDDDADIAFYTENALYWLNYYGADGLLLGGIKARKKEFFKRLVHSIKTEKSGAYIVAESDLASYVLGVDMTVDVSERYLNCFVGAEGLEQRLCARASAMTCLLFEKGRMLTRMGDELAQSCGAGVAFDRGLLNDTDHSHFQLFCSELNYAYLSYPSFWKCSECPDTVKKDTRGGIINIKRHTCDGDFMFVCDVNGKGAEMKISDSEEWRLIFDSNRILGISGPAILQKACGSTFLKLSPYGAAVLKTEIKN